MDSIKVKHAKKLLMNYKHDVLHPLYIQGRLGATFVDEYHNKCTASFRICKEPEDINKNLNILNKLTILCENENETKIINELKKLYWNFVKAYKEDFNLDFENKMEEIKILYKLLNNLKIDLRYNRQDIFEDYILVLKLNKFYKEKTNKDINYKPIFNSKTFNAQNSVKELNNILNQNFKNMNLFYNLTL